MKMKALVKLCKSAGYVMAATDDEGTQWMGDGHCLFPLYGMPTFSRESFCKTFEITEKQQDKITFRFGEGLPDAICASDQCDGERRIQEVDIRLGTEAGYVIPYMTQLGIRFMKETYMAPLADIENELTVYERMSESGDVYFAVKVGFMTKAIIMPTDILNKKFIEQISEISSQCQIAFFNKSEHTSGAINERDEMP